MECVWNIEIKKTDSERTDSERTYSEIKDS